MADKKYIGLDDQQTPVLSPAKKYIDLEEYKDPITKSSEVMAPFAGRAAVEMLPAVGSFFGPGGTLIGTGISQAMKRAKPEIFGKQPQGVDAAADAAKELVLNNLLPVGLGKLGGLALKTDMQGIGPAIASKLSNFPAVRGGLVKNITKQLERRIYPETGVIEQGAENAAARHGELSEAIETTRAAHPDIPSSKSLEFINGKPEVVEIPGGPAPETLAAMQHLSNVYGRNNVGGMLLRMQKEAKNFGGDIARTQTYKDISNTVLRDVTGVQNAKITGGDIFTRDLATNRILVGSGNPTEKTIDAAKALSEMVGKNAEIYQEAMGDSYGRLKGLLEEMNAHQVTNRTDTLMRYSNHKLIYSGVGAALGGIGGAAGGLALSSALPLTDWALRQIIKKPEAIELIRLALITPAKAPQATLINRALVEVLPRLIQGQADITFTPSR